MLRWPGNFIHFLFLQVVLTVFGLIYLFGRIGTLLFFWGDGGRRRAHAVGVLRGWVLRLAMTTLGATFIKMGQVMSTRPDLFSPEVIDQLRRLQDRLPRFSWRKVKRAIEEDLGPIDEKFAELDHDPVAAASVAQVHRGRLKDGREVAVKVLRPGVRRQVERDAAILHIGARLIALRPLWRLSDPVGHTHHFVEAIHDQTDLKIEADNYIRFRANFAGSKTVAFPEVITALCSSRILTMEFMRGTKIDALPPGRYPHLAEVVRTTMFKMCFEDGFLHADMHPGNMVVEESGRLVLFDVGLAKFLHEDVLIQFIDMSKCLVMGTPDDLVNHLRRFHTYLGEVDWEGVRRDVDAFAKHFRSQDIARLEYGELFSGMFAIGRKYKVHPVTDMMLVFVSLITAQGIGKMLEPEHNVFSAVATYLVPILMKRNEHVPETAEAKAARAAQAS